MDDPGSIAGWNLKSQSPHAAVLENPDANLAWHLETSASAMLFTLADNASGRQYTLSPSPGKSWNFQRK